MITINETLGMGRGHIRVWAEFNSPDNKKITVWWLLKSDGDEYVIIDGCNTGLRRQPLASRVRITATNRQKKCMEVSAG